MARWRWFQRADHQVDQIGPATRYLDQRGAYASGYVPERPAWADEPTEERAVIDSVQRRRP
jgi:hypothetical protein